MSRADDAYQAALEDSVVVYTPPSLAPPETTDWCDMDADARRPYSPRPPGPPPGGSYLEEVEMMLREWAHSRSMEL